MNILITGGASGIARKVIQRFLRSQEHIYVTVHNEMQKQLTQQKYQNNPNIEVLKLDVTNKKDLLLLENLTIDVFVSNAAIGFGGSISEIGMQKVRKNFEVNVFASFTMIQLVLKQMIQRGKGKIIILSSLAAHLPIPFLGVYCATKASITMLTQTLNKELKLICPDIHIVLIEPGLYHTGFNQVMLENKYEWMEKQSYFQQELKQIRTKENKMIQLLELQDLNTIVNKIEKAIKKEKPKFLYRAPLSQVIGIKLYQLFRT